MPQLQSTNSGAQLLMCAQMLLTSTGSAPGTALRLLCMVPALDCLASPWGWASS